MVGNKFLSIIIPVYNTEKYLAFCIESILSQPFDDYEIIIVNDGSTDGSGEIADAFAQQYAEKISVITQKNCGLGPARNTGIAQASGSFIMLVDSDDWIEENVLPSLCTFIKTYDFDLTLFDAYRTKSPFDYRQVSSGHRTQSIVVDKSEAIECSTNPAHAWKRIYRKNLFDGLAYPNIWFEDVALTPVITARAESIGYFKVPVYNYRISENSITSREGDPRNLEVIAGWQYVLDHCPRGQEQPLYRAVAKSIKIFCDYRPTYKNAFLAFYEDNAALFAPYMNEIEKDSYMEEKIPRIIHYCWFGGKEKPRLVQKCIDSWKFYNPDYEIREWNESNCNPLEIPFVQQAYVKQKWAFVADYFRFKALSQYGGIYLDTDVEANASADRLLHHEAFLGFEKSDVVNAAVLGAVKGHPFIGQMLDYYSQENYISMRGTIKELAIPIVIKHILETYRYQCNYNGELQCLKNGLVVYPVNMLCLNVFDGENIFEHHFDASWWESKPKRSYKNTVLLAYIEEVLKRR